MNSPTQKHIFQNKTIYLKRDDLLSKEFSGNKARKFFYYLDNEFPNVEKIVSYGSNQSNAMYSLSVLAKLKGWKFDYYVTHVPSYLEENPHGNYKYALENGMKLHVGRITPQALPSVAPIPTKDESILFIEEGGRDVYAEYGLKILAEEILVWKEEQGFDAINIFLPAGTGTTALYLGKSFNVGEGTTEGSACGAPRPTVFTTPCVGNVEYLKEQFKMLEKDVKFHPQIIEPSKKRHFGKLYRESYNIWLKLRHEMGVEFDLLYDPHGWLTLLENPELFDKPLLYIHQGGLLGNESMLKRYERKYNENI
ncbi:MAG TPA: 1-aminocyclopropane-1-carboxylate deaminase/D-cysteine desulfhydrase [Campylobacterales bacterium]|nr:1-aminocyclopropane-1-carboxylate deaminase/D-cysteine desulfhydrase [Campylobacterales bacterium]